METFKEIFELKSDISLQMEMQSKAVKYYEDIIKNGILNMEECKYFLLCLDRLYQNGFVSPLRDEEYDNILELFLDNGGEMIRGDLSSGNKAHHVYPNLKGTIKKVHYITEDDMNRNSRVKNHKSLEPWLKNIFHVINEKYPNKSFIKLGMYTKLDGLSIILEVEDGKVKSAITRGDKELGTGQDKTSFFKFMDLSHYSDILGYNKFGIKCEAIVSKNDFKKYNKKFEKLIDERSAATSILNSLNPTMEEIKFLTIVPLMIDVGNKEYPLPYTTDKKIDKAFDWIKDIVKFTGITISTKYDFRKTLKMIKELIQDLERQVKEEDYPADGIVIRVLDEDLIKELGRNTKDCINEWERAYKFKPETSRTTLLGIEQEIGLLGKVSFIAKVKPVVMKNKTIRSISLGSADRFKSLNLAIGDEVEVSYDIIPYLSVSDECKKSGNKPIELITHCPYCNEELDYNPELSCVNKSCPSREIGKIYNYCSKMDIRGIGEETIATLYRKGIVPSIAYLYVLDGNREAIKAIDGFGDTSISNMIKAINKVKTVDPATLLGALGIPKASKRVFEKVLNHINYEKLLFEDCFNELCNIKGIGPNLAKSIEDGIKENRNTIIEVSQFVRVKKKKRDMKVVFTGIRNKNFEDFLNKKNVDVSDSVTKDCDFVITRNENFVSSKTSKANKYGIPVITTDKAYVLFGYVEA